MKTRIVKLFGLLCLGCAAVSCSEKYPPQDFSQPKNGQIAFACTLPLADGSAKPWETGSKIGLFCPQTESVNEALEISASAVGSETGLFYSRHVWGEQSCKFSVYQPFNINNTSSVLNGSLPAAYAQASQSDDYLSHYNLIYGVAESAKPADGEPVAITLGSLFPALEIVIRSTTYTDWLMERVVVKAKDATALSGDYTFDMTSEEFAFTEDFSGEVTVNMAGDALTDEVHVWILTAPLTPASVPCDFEIHVAKEGQDNIKLSGSGNLTALTELAIDGFTAETMTDGSIDLSDPRKSGKHETANCYVAGLAGTTYKFPATVMGNGYTTPADPSYAPTAVGSASGITPTALNPKSARLLWQTSPDLLTNIRLRNGHVYFDTNGEAGKSITPGNAVIAVYSGDNATGDILWSWHIWVTDADLDGNLQTWKVHSSLSNCLSYQDPQLMDRNLGATTNLGFEAGGGNGSLGLRYQWGRKDPFVSADDSSFTSRVQVATYDFENKSIGAIAEAASFSPDAKWTAVKQQISRANVAKYPMAFVWSEVKWENTFFMEGDPAHDLWGCPGYADNSDNIGHKTIYDHCPPGYRVMNAYAMTGITPTLAGGKFADMSSHGVLNLDEYKANKKIATLQVQCNPETVAKLPSTGMVYFEQDEFPFNRVGTYGYYWTAKMTSGSDNRAYRVDYDYNNFRSMGTAYCSYGHSVRCEKVK